MGLYDRDYISSEQTLSDERVSFLKQTYQLLGASMVAAAAGAYATLPYAATISQYYWFIYGAELLILFFGLSFSRGKPTLNLAMLFLFTFMTGVTLVPLLSSFIGMGKSYVIGNAFAMTAVMFGALSLFAINTKKDFGSWGKSLFIIMLVIIAASLINFFFLHSPIMHIIITAGTLLLFGIFTIYDTQNIVNGAYSSPVDAAISLYLDFYNIFVSLLQLLGIFGDDD